MTNFANESEFRRCVVGLLSELHSFPVENVLTHERGLGTPDVCTSAAWLELKMGNRPQRSESRVVVNVRPAQRIWMRNWRRVGGRVWTLTLIDDQDWIMHDGAWACDHLGNVGMDDLVDAARGKFWPGCGKVGPTVKELSMAVMSRMTHG